MVDSVYIYLTDMPMNIHEMVAPCADGYTVYLNSRLSRSRQVEAYHHAMRHIQNRDWEKSDVQEIEAEAHHEDH